MKEIPPIIGPFGAEISEQGAILEIADLKRKATEYRMAFGLGDACQNRIDLADAWVTMAISRAKISNLCELHRQFLFSKKTIIT